VLNVRFHTVSLLFFCLTALSVAEGQEMSEAMSAKVKDYKQRVCVKFEELQGFKDDPKFKLYGFGFGPAVRWRKDVEALGKWFKPAFTHPVPLEVRSASGELHELGMEYMTESTETDYIRIMVPELKRNIGYDDYLKRKRQAAAQLKASAVGAKPTKLQKQSEAAQASRVWKSSTGKYQVSATLMSQSEQAVTLLTDDGRWISVPIRRLSPIDRAFIEKRSREERDE